MDGKCAAAIVRHANKTKDITFINTNYNRPFPWKEIEGQDVVMVDFTVQPYTDMILLNTKAKSLIWIDHHKTAIEAVEKLPVTIDGLRRINNGAGCELTWEWYYKDVEPPLAVEYIGDYDTWKFAFGDKTKRFQSGTYVRDMDPDEKIWNYLLNEGRKCDHVIDEIIKDGITIEKYNANTWKSRMKNGIFEIELDGHIGLACNYWGAGSNLFQSIENLYDKYDFTCVFSWNGKVWTSSLYTERKDIDVSKIATKLGGGGHAGAAGFVCEVLPFKRRENESQDRN
jgi:oligoribonuclease NrnB/cAMP/cGMP phosphodiesterase (DHH superfamily)